MLSSLAVAARGKAGAQRDYTAGGVCSGSVMAGSGSGGFVVLEGGADLFDVGSVDAHGLF